MALLCEPAELNFAGVRLDTVRAKEGEGVSMLCVRVAVGRRTPSAQSGVGPRTKKKKKTDASSPPGPPLPQPLTHPSLKPPPSSVSHSWLPI